jgi:putative ABC transport system permease protein
MLSRDDERPGAPPVVVVDEAWALRHFPGERAVGRRLREGGATTGPWTTVVGVVGDVAYAGLGGETGGTVYAPWTALAEAFVVVRAEGDAAELAGAAAMETRAADPTAPVTDVATGEALVGATLEPSGHLTLMLVLFSTVALGLAVIGVYGVTAHNAQSHRADIAVRIALGGSPGRVLESVVRQSLTLAALGLVVGVAASWAFTPLFADVLYGVDPNDTGHLLAVVALLASVALAAGATPAWRAIRSDPAASLREG